MSIGQSVPSTSAASGKQKKKKILEWVAYARNEPE